MDFYCDRLILVKHVLKDILMLIGRPLHTSLKEFFIRLRYLFLWTGKNVKEKMTLARWERLARTKLEGGGLKIFFIFPRLL
jgi:hypothetical protein